MSSASDNEAGCALDHNSEASVADMSIRPVALPRGGVTSNAEFKGPPQVGAQCYQGFPFCKPVVVQSIALHAVSAYRVSVYLVSAFVAHSTLFSPNVFNQQWNVY